MYEGPACANSLYMLHHVLPVPPLTLPVAQNPAVVLLQPSGPAPAKLQHCWSPDPHSPLHPVPVGVPNDQGQGWPLARVVGPAWDGQAFLWEWVHFGLT